MKDHFSDTAQRVHKKTMTMKWILVATAVLALTSSASAFEQTTTVPPPMAEGGAGVEVKPADQGVGVELNVPDVGTTAAGTEIQIPGLGTVGVLPKLDFGLELLYGANGQGGTDTETQMNDGELTVRGAVKKSF